MSETTKTEDAPTLDMAGLPAISSPAVDRARAFWRNLAWQLLPEVFVGADGDESDDLPDAGHAPLLAMVRGLHGATLAPAALARQAASREQLGELVAAGPVRVFDREEGDDRPMGRLDVACELLGLAGTERMALELIATTEVDPVTAHSARVLEGLLATISKSGAIKSTLTGGTGSELLYDVTVLPGGKVWAAGYTSTAAAGGRDGWLVRTTTSLATPVGYKVGTAKLDTLFSITRSNGGKLVAAGYSNGGSTGTYDGWIVQVEPKTGKTLWSRHHGGAKSDYFYGVTRNKSGGYVAAGRAYSYPPLTTDADTWQVSVHVNGQLVCK